MNQNNQDLETIVNALLKGIKQQPLKTEVKQPTWIENHFGVPKSGEEILWRICWLFIVPAIVALIYLQVGDWAWRNGLPLVTILTLVAILTVFWIVYQFASNSAGSLQKLVDLQFLIIAASAWFTIVFEGLVRYGS